MTRCLVPMPVAVPAGWKRVMRVGVVAVVVAVGVLVLHLLVLVFVRVGLRKMKHDAGPHQQHTGKHCRQDAAGTVARTGFARRRRDRLRAQSSLLPARPARLRSGAHRLGIRVRPVRRCAVRVRARRTQRARLDASSWKRRSLFSPPRCRASSQRTSSARRRA